MAVQPHLSDPAVIGFTLIMVGSFLTPVLSAPAPIKNEEWWVNSCNPQIVLQTRHGRSAEANQLKTFIHKIKLFIKELHFMYPKVRTENYSLKWLNSKRMETKLRMKKTRFQTFKEFYKSLQIFAFYMDKLKNVSISTSIKFNTAQRNQIYKNATENLKLVICEFEDYLQKANMKVPKFSKNKKLFKRKIEEKMDYSKVSITDIQFFKTMKKFMKIGRKKLYEEIKKHNSAIRT